MNTGDTIVAISTPPGAGGIGIVRLSGPASRAIAGGLVRFGTRHEWRAWTASLGTLTDENGEDVDQVVVTFFAAPHSYTAEDVVEISCHGSPVVLRHAVSRALDLGARPAEPGEFTLRAYLNGRINLPQAEAVRDLIHSTTLYQARVAARQLEGSVARALQPAKNQVLELIALLEAGIDFADDDVAVAGNQEIRERVDRILTLLDPLIRSFAFGRFVHDGVTLAIVGRPNAGKSSLFNRLLERDRAIVTAIPGTTRDTVSETASIAGLPVKFVDTAGIRQTADAVERLGIDRTYQAMADADITIVVVDLSAPLTGDDRLLMDKAASSGRYLVAANKVDLPRLVPAAPGWTPVSALTGEGIEALRAKLVETISPGGAQADVSGLITSARHEHLLQESAEALRRAREAAGFGLPHEMLLLDCYAALRPLDAITGATTVDDILNRIFSTFCIGK